VPSLRTHRIRAVTSSLVEGLAVGGLLAGREAPPWSRPRVLIATAAGALLIVDQLSVDLPRVLREARTLGTVGAPPPEERRALVEAGVRAVAGGLALQLLDRPVRGRLARRGIRHPHRWFGAAAGLIQVAVVAPVYWRLAADRVRREAELDAAIEAELQEIAAGH
jgi:hypothetical protein